MSNKAPLVTPASQRDKHALLRATAASHDWGVSGPSHFRDLHVHPRTLPITESSVLSDRWRPSLYTHTLVSVGGSHVCTVTFRKGERGGTHTLPTCENNYGQRHTGPISPGIAASGYGNIRHSKLSRPVGCLVTAMHQSWPILPKAEGECSDDAHRKRVCSDKAAISIECVLRLESMVRDAFLCSYYTSIAAHRNSMSDVLSIVYW